MGYVHRTAIEQIDAEEGTRRIELVARHDGKFQFYEYKRDGRPYWLFVHLSGFYESVDVAERDG